MANPTLGTATLNTYLNLSGLNRGLGRARQETGETFGTLDRRIQQTGQRMQGFGRTMSLAVTAPIVGLGVAAVRTAGQFEQSMNRVRAITGATGDDFERLRGLAAELGESTQFSASEAADGMGFLAQAGFEVDEIMSALPGTLELASAGQLDLARAADLASNVLSGFGLEASEIGRVNDTMAATASSANTSVSQLGRAMSFAAPVAAGMGVSVEEASAAVGLLSNAGIQGERAGTALRGILGQLSKNADDLGISMRDAQGNMLPVVEILEQLEAQGFTAQDAMNAVGMEAGPALTALLSQGSGALRELTDELENAEGTAGRMAETQMEGLNGQLRELRSAAEGLAIAVGDAGLLEAVTNLAQGATTLVRRFGELDESTQTMMVRGTALAAAIGPVSLALGKVVTIAPRVVAGLRAIRVAMAALAGPAGIIALVATGLGVTLVNAHRKHDRAVDEAIGKADDFQEKLGDANTPSSVRYAVNQLAREMEGDAKDAWKTFADEAVEQADRAREAGQTIGDVDTSGSAMSAIQGIAEELRGPAKDAWVTYAEQAIASAEDVQDVVRTIAAGRAFLENQGEINRLTQDLDQLEAERDRVVENRTGRDRQQAQQEIQDLENTIRELEGRRADFERRGMEGQVAQTDRVIQNTIDRLDAVRERVGDISGEQSERVRELNDQIIELRRQIDELSGTTVDIPDVNVEATVTGGGTGRQPAGDGEDDDGVATPPPGSEPPPAPAGSLAAAQQQLAEERQAFELATTDVAREQSAERIRILEAEIAEMRSLLRGAEGTQSSALLDTGSTSPRSLGTGLEAGAFGQPDLETVELSAPGFQVRTPDGEEVPIPEFEARTPDAVSIPVPEIEAEGPSFAEMRRNRQMVAQRRFGTPEQRDAFTDQLTAQAAARGIGTVDLTAPGFEVSVPGEQPVPIPEFEARVPEPITIPIPEVEAEGPSFEEMRRDRLGVAQRRFGTAEQQQALTDQLLLQGRVRGLGETGLSRALSGPTEQTPLEEGMSLEELRSVRAAGARVTEDAAEAERELARQRAMSGATSPLSLGTGRTAGGFGQGPSPAAQTRLERGFTPDEMRDVGRAGAEVDRDAAEEERQAAQDFHEQIAQSAVTFTGSLVDSIQSGDIGGAFESLLSQGGGLLQSAIGGVGGILAGGALGIFGSLIGSAFSGDDQEEQRREEERRRSRNVPAINVNFQFDQINHYQGGPQMPQVEQAYRRQAVIAIEEFMNRTKLVQRVEALEG